MYVLLPRALLTYMVASVSVMHYTGSGFTLVSSFMLQLIPSKRTSRIIILDYRTKALNMFIFSKLLLLLFQTYVTVGVNILDYKSKFFRHLPQHGHFNWQVHFSRTFDCFSKLWKFQQVFTVLLSRDSDWPIKRHSIVENWLPRIDYYE